MERQQNHYRTVLETAHQSAEDNKPTSPIPAWALPKNPRTANYFITDNIFSSQLGQYVDSHVNMMNYFQFCRIVESLLIQHHAVQLRDVVRFRRKQSLSFPAGEIASIDKHKDELPSIRTTFLGLYGVDSILPDYFLNDIATHREGSDSLAAFLDIFNHRISELFYFAWKKYRYPLQFEYGGIDKVSLSLLHLIGQITQPDRTQKLLYPSLDSKILGLLGVFHQKTRTADGIRNIVKYLYPKSEVKVLEFRSQWVELNNRVGLGQRGLKLDRGSAILGSRIRDNGHLIHIDITPNSFAAAQELLPNHATHTKLLELLKVYLGYRVDAAIYLNIKKQWISQTKIKAGHMLGFTTGLGSKMQDKRIKVGHYTYTV